MIPMPEIKTEPFHNSDDTGGEWEVIRVMVGDDFYVDIACRDGEGAEKKIAAMAADLKDALVQTMVAQYEQQQTIK